MRVNFYTVLKPIYFIPIIWGILLVSSCDKDDETRAPEFSYMSKRMASVGKEVIIHGNNFAPSIADNAVAFNGTPATITDATSLILKMTVPDGATTGPVTVTSYGKSVFAGYFTVYVPGTVTSLSPICGPVGTVVTATGNFSPFPQLTKIGVTFKAFNYSDISLLSSSPTQITFAVPRGMLTDFIHFSYEEELFNVAERVAFFRVVPFRLTGYSPASGQIGSAVTITGEFFDANPANISVLFWGPGSIQISAPLISSGSNQVTVLVPPGAVTGPLVARMNGPDGVTFPDDFVVVP